MTSLLLVVLLAQPGVGAAESPLPKTWHGTWTGTMLNTRANGTVQKIPINFVVAPIEGTKDLTWKMTYGKKPQHVMVKDYKLIPGKGEGRLKIDEGGDLKLDARLVGNVLYSMFSMDHDPVLTARYELRGDKLHFEVTSNEPAGKPMNAGLVQGYRVVVVQAVELTRPK